MQSKMEEIYFIIFIIGHIPDLSIYFPYISIYFSIYFIIFIIGRSPDLSYIYYRSYSRSFHPKILPPVFLGLSRKHV